MKVVNEGMLRTTLLVVVILLGAVHGTRAAERPPNVLLIISDDQAWTDYGFMGHPIIRTPHLDRLASQSAVFERGYVPTALCRPSLATIITGLYAHQHGLTGNDPSPLRYEPRSPLYDRMREKMIERIDRLGTLPRWLKAKSYLSFQSGKWWEGSYRRGGFTHGMTRGFPQPGGRHGDDGLEIGRKGLEPVFQFIQSVKAADKPFFLWYAPMMPHTPHNPPERLLAYYRDRTPSLHVARYYAMCEWFDETCGALLEYLDRQGLSDETLVIYVADNGWIQDPDGPQFALRSKQSPYEGGVRQPILVRWPGKIAPERRRDLVSSIDIAPTVLAAAGLPIPEELPGINLLPFLQQRRPIPRDTLFGETFAHDVADVDDPQESLLYRWVIHDRWKLLLSYDGDPGRHAALHPRGDLSPQLFDLIADPHEQHNVAKEHPELVQSLAEKIESWWPVTKRRTRLEP
ncbi:MAG: sulfatase [Pirellulaceae bacterium]|nr:MAG: sulfatase [Pirellulaceae bacterium]